MAHIRLGPLGFTTSAARDELAALRTKYMQLGLRHRTAFFDSFRTIRSADDLFQNFPEHITRAFNEAAALVASDLSGKRIYDIDMATIRFALSERAEAVRTSFDRVQRKYHEIIGKAAELDAQRTADREDRARIIGGGFGLEGAAQGMAMAGAANMAIGVTYGLANLTAKAASMLGDAKKKRALLEDPTTAPELADFLCRLVLQGYKLVADLVNERAEEMIFAVVSIDDQKRAAALTENVIAGRVPEADIRAALIQSLELDPFADKSWRTWIDRYGDPDGSVSASAAKLGVTTINAHKQKLLSRTRSSLDWSTVVACGTNRQPLEDEARRLGLSFEPERQRIRAQIEKLELEQRTYKGVAYRSAAEAKHAERTDVQRESDRLVAESIEADRRSRTLFDTTYDTLDEFREARRRHNKKVLRGWGCFFLLLVLGAVSVPLGPVLLKMVERHLSGM